MEKEDFFTVKVAGTNVRQWALRSKIRNIICR